MDHMTLLAGLRMTPERLEARRKWIGASEAKHLVGSDHEAVRNLWLEKRGEKAPDDLSEVLPVMLGLFTEEFNAAWFEQKTGRRIEARGEGRTSPAFDFMHCTLDGLTDAGQTVWQAKHVNAFSKIEDVVARYMPQLHHEMHCAQVDRAVLSVLHGTLNFHVIEVRRDDWFLARLIEAEREFWDCVQTGREPRAAGDLAPTEAIEAIRTVDMQGNNAWAAAAVDWVENRPAAALFDDAVKLLKDVMPKDARIAFGHGIKATRAKNGAVKISQHSEEQNV